MNDHLPEDNPFEAPEAPSTPFAGKPVGNVNKLAYRSLGLSLLLKMILLFVFCAAIPIALMNPGSSPRFPWIYLPSFFFEIAVLAMAFSALKRPGEGRWAAIVSIFICVGTLLFLLLVFIAPFMNF